MKTDSEYANYDKLENIFGIKKGTLYALVSRQKIPHVRIGPRHVLFSIKEIQTWLQLQKVPVNKKDWGQK